MDTSFYPYSYMFCADDSKKNKDKCCFPWQGAPGYTGNLANWPSTPYGMYGMYGPCAPCNPCVGDSSKTGWPCGPCYPWGTDMSCFDPCFNPWATKTSDKIEVLTKIIAPNASLRETLRQTNASLAEFYNTFDDDIDNNILNALEPGAIDYLYSEMYEKRDKDSDIWLFPFSQMFALNANVDKNSDNYSNLLTFLASADKTTILNAVPKLKNDGQDLIAFVNSNPGFVDKIKEDIVRYNSNNLNLNRYINTGTTAVPLPRVAPASPGSPGSKAYERSEQMRRPYRPLYQRHDDERPSYRPYINSERQYYSSSADRNHYYH